MNLNNHKILILIDRKNQRGTENRQSGSMRPWDSEYVLCQIHNDPQHVEWIWWLHMIYLNRLLKRSKEVYQLWLNYSKINTLLMGYYFHMYMQSNATNGTSNKNGNNKQLQTTDDH